MKQEKRTPLLSGFKGMDIWLFISVMLLCCFGIYVVYTGTYETAKIIGLESKIFHLPAEFYFLENHLFVFCFGGISALLIGLFIDYSVWRKLYVPTLIFALALLPLVFIFGKETKGAKRWISLGAGMTVQPSEFLKFGISSFLAAKISTFKEPVLLTKEFAKIFILPGIAILGTLVFQKNYSLSLMLLLIILFITLTANVPLKPLLIRFLPLLGVLSVLALILPGSDYRKERFIAHYYSEEILEKTVQDVSSVNKLDVSDAEKEKALENWKKDMIGKTHQKEQAMLAIGSGGLFGKGTGAGTQKIGYMPESYTDCAFAVFAEERGFIGTTLLLGLFAFIFYRGIKISKNANTRYAKLLSIGLIAAIFCNTSIHIAVNTGLMPTTGQVLPFISYGGTNLCMNMFMIGVLLNISKPNTGNFFSFKEDDSRKNKMMRYYHG